ncbi:NUDIX hydrolase [Halocalculus aciditolerans]|uniref:NUDIX hydrolase n=1 Tax=Halocalculus aciditolerans TaxID=1383812 RepID=A0A830FA01_9EURY|nr:NUDIX domain-containing protein [Halocalculus aciditolerans]GGL53837.1 NUDIX hydrolase [Halocalculus aciditolerans]
MRVDDRWYRAQQSAQRGEQAYHDLRERYDDFTERERTQRVSRGHFETLVDRIDATGAPFGAHTLVYRPDGDLLLVRHTGVDLWVLPGGGVESHESYREAAERELREEAGVDATYDGLAILTRLTIESGDYRTTGVLPVFEATTDQSPVPDDPDEEISAARWFTDLPRDTRDRDTLVQWRNRRLRA